MHLTLLSIHIEPSSRAVPLATAMLAATLGRSCADRVTTGLVDCFLDQSAEACAQAVLRQEPDCVGLSVYVWNRERMLAVAARLKELRPELILFAGGPEVTADPEGFAAERAVDFVMPGEGEECVAQAMELLLAGCPAGQVGARLRPGPVRDLAALPSPFLDNILPPERYAGLLWELSRGCPFRCDFCFESRGGSGVRRFPFARLRAELELFAACGVRQLFVLDPTFNYQPAQAKQLLRLMAQVAPHIHYTIEIRAEFVDEEMAELFAGLDCALQIGLQSAHPEVLAKVHRTLNREDFAERILLLHQAGVAYGFDLIFGLPGDSLAGFLDSLDFALALRPNHLDIFPLAVLPGTRLAETATSFGLRHQDRPPYRVLSSPGFAAADMERAEQVARACDLFYNGGRAVPWFDLVVGELGLTPAEFFQRLAERLPAEPPEGLAVIAWQQQVLTELFRSRGMGELATVAADVVAWFGHGAALACGEVGEQAEAPRPGRIYLQPECCFVSFSRNPEALLEWLEAGVDDLETLAGMVAEDPCEALLYLHEGDVALGLFTPRETAWLKSLRPAGGCRPDDGELAALCEAALAEGLVLEG
jgi:hypothetical protein